MPRAKWVGIGVGTLVAMLGCGAPNDDGEVEVETTDEALTNTAPSGTRWVVSDEHGVPNAEDAVELVFDDDEVFWLTSGRTFSPSITIPIRIYAAPRAGGGERRLVMQIDDPREDDDPPAPEAGRDLAIRGDTLYFGTSHRIGSVRSDGSDLRTLTFDARMGVRASLAVDDSHIYWIRQGSIIRRMSLAGGTPVTITTGAAMRDIVLDGDHAYWVETGSIPQDTNGRVRRVLKTGGTAMTVVAGQRKPVHLGVSATYIVYTDGGFTGQDGTVYPARIRRKNKDGSGSVRTIRTPRATPRDLEVVGGKAFFIDGNVVRRLWASGSSQTYVSTHERPGRVLGTDAENVAWTTSTHFDRVGIRLTPAADVAPTRCGDLADVIADADAPLGLGTSGTWTYFTDPGAGTVSRVWRNGSSLIEDVQTGAVKPDNLTAKLDGVFWTEEVPGGYVVAGRRHDGGCSMGSGTDVPMDLTADTTRGEAYVISDRATIRRFYDDCVGDDSVVVGHLAGRGAGIVDQGDYLYATHTTLGAAALSRMAKSGDAIATRLATIPEDGAGRPAIDGTHVYFFTTRGRLVRVSSDGGAADLIADGIDGAYDIALDGSYVYLSVQGEGGADVLRFSKATGARVTLASGAGTAWELDADGSCIAYAVTDQDGAGAIMKVDD